ncbi:Hypothetical predicted protein, partial [Podarcis lilfordi]
GQKQWQLSYSRDMENVDHAHYLFVGLPRSSVGHLQSRLLDEMGLCLEPARFSPAATIKTQQQ